MPALKDKEVKFAITKEGQETVKDALPALKGEIEEYTVHFFDTDNLALAGKDLFLRVRQITKGLADETDDATCKLRGDKAAAAYAKYGEGNGKRKLEGDINVDQPEKPSFSITSAPPLTKIATALADGTLLSAVFEPDASKMISETGVVWGNLLAYGPIKAKKWKAHLNGWDGKVTVEHWTTTNGTTILEVSDKVAAEKADDFAQALSAYLKKQLKVTQLPESKTKLALSNSAKNR